MTTIADREAAERYFGPTATKKWAERYGPAPTEPIPASESYDVRGKRHYRATLWPTAPLFDWLVSIGVSPWSIVHVHGIQVKWDRPYLTTWTVDRVCCKAERVHPSRIYGWTEWAELADWEYDRLEDSEAEQLTLGVAS